MSDIFQADDSTLLPPSWDSMCVDNFLKELASEITGACMIPMNLPKKEVYNIVQRAKKWFHKNYEYSVRENMFYIPVSTFESEYFKRTRSLTLPKEDPSTGGGEIW